MKQICRRLALFLAMVLALSAAAYAAPTGINARRLVAYLLTTDESGESFQIDTDGGYRGWLTMTPGDTWAAVFYIRSGNDMTPVIPEAGEGASITPIPRSVNEAQDSDCYVYVSLDSWSGANLTYDDLSFRINPVLPMLGFYTAPEFSRDTCYLGGNVDELDQWELYFGSWWTDAGEHAHLTAVDVAENSEHPELYTVERYENRFWKLTLSPDAFDGREQLCIRLIGQMAGTDGRTYEYQRELTLCRRTEKLYAARLSWTEEGTVRYLPEGGVFSSGLQPHPGETVELIFFTCDVYDSDGLPAELAPVLPEELTCSEGVGLTPLENPDIVAADDPWAPYYCQLTVDEFQRDYTVGAGGCALYFDSNLPDLGSYSAPELTPEAYLGSWAQTFSPIRPDTVYYIGSPCTDETRGFHLKSLSLDPTTGDNRHFSLKRYNDEFYALSLKPGTDLTAARYIAQVSYTWEDSLGTVWDGGTAVFAFVAAPTLVYSEEPLLDGTMVRSEEPAYGEAADRLSDTLELDAGEERTIYLYQLFYDGYHAEDWSVYHHHPDLYVSDSEALSISHDEADTSKFTVRAAEAGSYTIYYASGAGVRYLDRDGRELDEDGVSRLCAQTYGEAFESWTWPGGSYVVARMTDGVTVVAEGISVEEIPGGSAGYAPLTVSVSTTGYLDVASRRWYAPAVDFVTGEGLMTGKGEGTFCPLDTITGAEFVQILYNLEGRPEPGGASFAGVSGQWYAPAVIWAAGAGLITDQGDEALAPAEPVTRQQMALILYNYMDRPSAAGQLDFPDGEQVSPWAADALAWAVSQGVLSGTEQNGQLCLAPQGLATRAQTAQMLMNYFGGR